MATEKGREAYQDIISRRLSEPFDFSTMDVNRQLIKPEDRPAYMAARYALYLFFGQGRYHQLPRSWKPNRFLARLGDSLFKFQECSEAGDSQKRREMFAENIRRFDQVAKEIRFPVGDCGKALRYLIWCEVEGVFLARGQHKRNTEFLTSLFHDDTSGQGHVRPTVDSIDETSERAEVLRFMHEHCYRRIQKVLAAWYFANHDFYLDWNVRALPGLLQSMAIEIDELVKAYEGHEMTQSRLEPEYMDRDVQALFLHAQKGLSFPKIAEYLPGGHSEFTVRNGAQRVKTTIQKHFDSWTDPNGGTPGWYDIWIGVARRGPSPDIHRELLRLWEKRNQVQKRDNLARERLV